MACYVSLMACDCLCSMAMGSSDWIAVGSLLAAWVAAMMACGSWFVARRSLAFAKEQTLGARPRMVPYLVDGFVASERRTGKRIYAFSVSLSNRSNTDNSLSNTELLLTYFRPNQPTSTLVLAHDAQLGALLNINGGVLSRTEPVPAHQTIVGWIFCGIDERILDGAAVDSYEVRFTDSHGIQAKLTPVIMRELVDEKMATI
jgi:hypothetical protein